MDLHPGLKAELMPLAPPFPTPLILPSLYTLVDQESVFIGQSQEE